MVLLTVAVGFVLGARGSSHPATMALALLGTGLVAAGASAWNQVIERDRDAPDAADRPAAPARRPAPAVRGGRVRDRPGDRRAWPSSSSARTPMAALVALGDVRPLCRRLHAA